MKGKKTRWIVAIVLVLAVAAVDFVLRQQRSRTYLHVMQAESDAPVVGARVHHRVGTEWVLLGTTDDEGRLRLSTTGELSLRIEAAGREAIRHRAVIPRGQEHHVRMQPEDG